MTTTVRNMVFAIVLGVAACGGEQQDRSAQETRATGDTGRMGDMQGMAGMQGKQGMRGMGGMMDTTMMQRMQEHMQMMMGASADRMKAMMPEHRQMAANMLAQMNREMRQMNMAGDSAWTATADSARQDLVRMPEMDPAELKAFMPAHRARMTRMIEMHRKMMANMGM